MDSKKLSEKQMPVEHLNMLAKKVSEVLKNHSGSIKSWNAFPFEQVTFDNYTADSLRMQWKRLKTKAHRLSTMEQDIDLIDALLKRAKDRRRLDLPSDFPKKPISAYNIFLSKVIKNGSLLEYDSKDRFVQAARIWKGLDPAKKEKFFKKYRLAVEKHDVQMEEFKAAHPELNIRPTPKSKRKLDAKTVRNEQQPSTSHPSTSKHVDLHEASFQCFALAKQDKYAEKYNLRGEDLMKKLRRKFDRMSADKQQKWHDFVTKENCIDCPMTSIKRDGAA